MKYQFFLITCIIICFQTCRLKGQDAEFSQFFANPLYMNPAFAGTNDGGRFALNYRNQWPQKGTAFNTYSVSFDDFSDKHNTGWGFQLMHDRQLSNFISSYSGSMYYSYHLRLDHYTFIAGGIQAGFVHLQMDPGNLIFPSMINQLTGEVSAQIPYNFEYNRKTYPDLGMGIIGQFNDFFAGFSIHHLNQPNESLLKNDGLGKLPIKFTGHVGAKLFRFHRGLLSREFTLSPQFIYRQQGNFKQLNVGIYLIEQNFVVGAWYRNNISVRPNALVFLAGVANQKLQFGYSFDLTLSKLSNYSYGSHEVSLSFFINNPVKKRNKRQLVIPII